MRDLSLIKMAAAAFGCIMLVGCATPEERAEAKAEEAARLKAGKGEQVNRICFAGGLNGFGETTRNTVVVRKNSRERFLLETRGCFQLENAQSIGLVERAGCLSRGDRLLVSEDIFVDNVGQPPERCLITAIYRWNDPDRQPKERDEEDNMDEGMDG